MLVLIMAMYASAASHLALYLSTVFALLNRGSVSAEYSSKAEDFAIVCLVGMNVS
jgi:hypothetical protein